MFLNLKDRLLVDRSFFLKEEVKEEKTLTTNYFLFGSKGEKKIAHIETVNIDDCVADIDSAIAEKTAELQKLQTEKSLLITK
jgi:hypothetical protein